MVVSHVARIRSREQIQACRVWWLILRDFNHIVVPAQNASGSSAAHVDSHSRMSRESVEALRGLYPDQTASQKIAATIE